MILRLVDLPWYDVVYTHIFIRLDLRDLCRLRCLSQEYRVLVDNYLATWDTLDLTPYASFGSFVPGSFEGLVRACESLRRVNLSYCYWLRSFHLAVLLALRPELTHLDLTGLNRLRFRRRRCMRRTGKKNEEDGDGDDDGDDGDDDDGIIETIESHVRNLTSVRLRGCTWVTGDFLSTLLRHNCNLRELELADCYQLSDEDVGSMFESRTALTSLSLEMCTITDKSLSVISEKGCTIEFLDLTTCIRITDKGLMLLRSLRSLKKLWVVGCALVTERGLAPLRARVDIDVLPSPICRVQPPNLQV